MLSFCSSLSLFLSFSSICLLYTTACLPQTATSVPAESPAAVTSVGTTRAATSAAAGLATDCTRTAAAAMVRLLDLLPVCLVWWFFAHSCCGTGSEIPELIYSLTQIRPFWDHFSEEKKQQNILLEQTFRNSEPLDRKGLYVTILV